MADDRMTRFDAELFEAAVDEGQRENRSARQQLEHWTRLGRQLSVRETGARPRWPMWTPGVLTQHWSP